MRHLGLARTARFSSFCNVSQEEEQQEQQQEQQQQEQQLLNS